MVQWPSFGMTGVVWDVTGRQEMVHFVKYRYNGPRDGTAGVRDGTLD